MTQLAINAEDISKRFVRYTDQRNTLKERFVRGRAKKSQDFWALKNVSIGIPKGSVYGLIGHNGNDRPRKH